MIPYDAEVRRIARLVFEELYDVEIIKAYKTSDTSRDTTTSPTADAHLTTSLAASSNYAFRFVLFTSNVGALEGVQFQLDGTVGITSLKAQIQIYDDTTNAIAAFGRITAFNSAVGVALSTGSNCSFIEGSIETSTAGTFALEWAQAVSGGNATVLQRNSYLAITKIS